MTNNTTAPLPDNCPFCCGHAAPCLTSSHRTGVFVYCLSCLASTNDFDTKEEALAAWKMRQPTQSDPEDYELGKRDGYESAVQDIDMLTGGDGEYCYSTFGGERHCPDPDSMKARIAERFNNQPTQSDALLDAEGVKLYWYRQGKDDGVEHERAKIVAWLMREEDDYPSGKYSGFAAMVREEIEAGEHLK